MERLQTNFSPRDITSVSEGVTVHPERLTTVFKVSVLGFGVVVGRGPWKEGEGTSKERREG